MRMTRGASGHNSSASYDNEIRYGKQSNVSNPFLNGDSDSESDSSSPSGSYSRSFSSSMSESCSTEDLDDDNGDRDNSRELWNQREREAMQQEARPELEPPLASSRDLSVYALPTLHEVSEENLSRSSWSLMSERGGRSEEDKSVYRAGIEALVKEACPEKTDTIDEMMKEYEGREEVLIGQLSYMLAAKNRRASIEALVKEACPEKTDNIDKLMMEYEGSEEVLIGHLSYMIAVKTGSGGSPEYEEDTEDEGGEQYSSASTSECTFDTDTSGYMSSSVTDSRRSSIDSNCALGTLETEDILKTENTLDTTAAVVANNERVSPDLNVTRAGWVGGEARSPSVGAADSANVPPLGEEGGNTATPDTADHRQSTVSAAILAAGSASVAVAASLFSGNNQEDDKSLRDSSSMSSSDADSSGWSSDDGFSSIDASSFTTGGSNQSSVDMAGLAMSPEAAAFAASRDSSALDHSVAYLGGAKPMFVPVNGSDSPGSHGEEDDPLKVATREDLDEAIQAGDWKAVGATAALIVHESPDKNSRDDSLDALGFDTSKMSESTNEQDQVEELEHLVEAGDWRAVVAAASRFENASDSESMSKLDDLPTGPEEYLAEANSNRSPMISPDTSPERNDDRSRSPHRSSFQGTSDDVAGSSPELRAAIEELVRRVVPEELENLDDMMKQFRGREEELLSTLNTMSRESDDFMTEDEESRDQSLSVSVYEGGGDVQGDTSFSAYGVD